MSDIEMPSKKAFEPPPYSSDLSLTGHISSNDRNQQHRGRQHTRYHIDGYYFALGISELVSGLELIITSSFKNGNSGFEEALLSASLGLGVAQLTSFARRFTLSFKWNRVPPPQYATRVFWSEIIFIILSLSAWVALSFVKASLLEHDSHEAQMIAQWQSVQTSLLHKKMFLDVVR